MTAIALFVVLAVICLSARHSRRRIVDDRTPDPTDRLAAWEIRRGRYLAEQRRRTERVQQRFDARAQVQIKVTPRLPG